ncbi:MAG: HEPN domain-containing protein [Balneolaceae bacterium]
MRRSKSFIILKEHSQSILDFSVLVCTAVPQLRHALNEHESDPSVFIASNSHFRESHEPYSTERRTLTKYKAIQGANLLLSNFSFFESFFFNLIDEIIEFHCCEEEFLNHVKSHIAKEVTLDESDNRNLSKLRKSYEIGKRERYRKYTELVKPTDIIWPSERLALYGAHQMISNRKRWKSVDIPKLCRNLLAFDIEEETEGKFHNIRDERNNIAHGKRLSYDLQKATEANYFLYKFAKDIDEHVVKTFFIIERLR